MQEKFAALKTVEDIAILKGTSFEDYLADLFSDLGFQVSETPASGDFGADVILVKGKEKITIQAKQYSRPVGFAAVKEAHFARTYYSANQSWVIALHGFTQQAVQAAEAAGIRLIDGDELLSLSIRAQSGHSKGDAFACEEIPIIDHDLLKASIAVVKNRKALPGYLQQELGIGPDKASMLLKRMESLGIVTRKSDGKRAIISKKKLVELVDTNYDPSSTKPRFLSDIGFTFEVFRGSGPDSITIVENPSTRPSFYLFERDPQCWDSWKKWACVGIDAIDDASDLTDIEERLGRVSKLKLYDILNFTDATQLEVVDIDTLKTKERMVCKEFNPIAHALYSARTGDARMEKPGFTARRLKEIEKEAKQKKEREEAERIRQKEMEEARKRSDRKTILLLIGIPSVALLLLLSSCIG